MNTQCNRIWPCNHCNKRAVAHLCSFQPARRRPSLEQDGQRENGDKTCEETPQPPGVDGLGYRDGWEHFNLGALMEGETHARAATDSTTAEDEAVTKALSHIPGRSLTDALVQRYLQHDNLQYYSLYPPAFLDAYSAWWASRVAAQPVPPALTALILQICANATQGLDDELGARLQYDLAERNEETSLRLFDAAESLSRSIPPGSGGLDRVMRLALAAAWLKTEGRIVDGWHVLSVAVREAQECGLGGSDNDPRRTEMEVEIRRRIWCYIVVWDWQMAEWLSRPMLTTVDTITPAPNPAVDVCVAGRPSPIANLCEQFKLVRALSTPFGRLAELSDARQIRQVVDLVDDWTKQLPPELRMVQGDRSWDEQCSWLPSQRASLHCFAQMARLIPLKPCLTASSPARDNISDQDPIHDHDGQSLKHLAADASVACIEAALTLHRTMQRIRRTFHFLVFALFDTATLICSALLHDRERGTLRAAQPLLQFKAGQALAALEEIARRSTRATSAQQGARVLRWLLARLETAGDLTAEDTAADPTSVTPVTCGGTKGTASPPSSDPIDSVPSSSSQDLFDFDAETSFSPQESLTFDDLLDWDMGGVESIWDWEALGLGDAVWSR